MVSLMKAFDFNEPDPLNDLMAVGTAYRVSESFLCGSSSFALVNLALRAGGGFAVPWVQLRRLNPNI